MGNNRPSQAKRRKARARRERLLQEVNKQHTHEGVISKETHCNLVNSFLKVPIDQRELIFKNSLCDSCLSTLPKLRCIKCFTKNVKFRKVEEYIPSTRHKLNPSVSLKRIQPEQKHKKGIVVPRLQPQFKPKANTVVDAADLSKLTLEQKLQRISNSFCEKHLGRQATDLCLDCLQRQYEVSTSFLEQKNQAEKENKNLN